MYLRIDEGFADHPKTLRFCSLMQNPEAAIYLIRLWTWACRSAPDGDLTGMDAYEIEMAVRYRLLDRKCFDAMLKAGFIDEQPDGTTKIHDWLSWTGALIERATADSGRRAKYGTNWESVRLVTLARDGFACTQCPATERLDVHHIIPVRSFDSPEAANVQTNLLTICRPCHLAADADRRRERAARARIAGFAT